MLWKKSFLFLLAPLLLAAMQQQAAPDMQGETPAEPAAETEAIAEEPVDPADLAYVPPVVAEPALPEFPEVPQLDTDSYPGCREDYKQLELPYDQAEATTVCVLSVDKYYEQVMLPYRQRMIEYQQAVSALYTDKVGNKDDYSPASQTRFYKAMREEHAKANPDGDYQEIFRETEARYQRDRTYLLDRFCFNTGCGGYPLPELAGKLKVEKKQNDESDKKQKRETQKDKKRDRQKASGSSAIKCKEARRKGGGIGAFLGGLAGQAAGLGNVGTLLASGLTGVLAAEIACKLTEEEQVEAAEATVEVTEKEEVGATATWVSPERKGVSGSSTITKVASQANGGRCLDITDVVIVDGEETTVAKRMCRQPGEQRYAIA